MAHPIHEATESSPYGDHLKREDFYKVHQVFHEENFMVNKQSLRIFTQSWRPASTPPADLRGLVAMIHGYSSESGWTFELTAVAIARLGFHVCAIDLRGHGRSDGPGAHIPDIRPLVDDCMRCFESARSASPHLPAFLYGESLGGAIATLIALEQKDAWQGLVLNGAMCGVSKEFKPVWPLEELLPAAAFLAPMWRVIVTKSLVKKSFRETWKRELVRRNPRAPKSEYPSAATALELLKVCREIGTSCKELELPLLIVHGERDSVCDSASAELVYKSARSEDKTIRIIPGMWHQMIGDTKENVELGFGFIYAWLKDRARGAPGDDGNGELRVSM